MPHSQVVVPHIVQTRGANMEESRVSARGGLDEVSQLGNAVWF